MFTKNALRRIIAAALMPARLLFLLFLLVYLCMRRIFSVLILLACLPKNFLDDDDE